MVESRTILKIVRDDVVLDGTINGNRLPWIYTVDMRMSKKFVFGFKFELLL